MKKRKLMKKLDAACRDAEDARKWVRETLTRIAGLSSRVSDLECRWDELQPHFPAFTNADGEGIRSAMRQVAQ